MDLGLPLDFFIREVLVIATYGALTIACARHWDRGPWARVGAIAGALGFVLRTWTLAAFVLVTNGHRSLVEALDRVAEPMIWVDLAVLVGLALAVVLGRDRREAQRA